MTAITFAGTQHIGRAGSRPGKHEPYDRRQIERETREAVAKSDSSVPKDSENKQLKVCIQG